MSIIAKAKLPYVQDIMRKYIETRKCVDCDRKGLKLVYLNPSTEINNVLSSQSITIRNLINTQKTPADTEVINVVVYCSSCNIFYEICYVFKDNGIANKICAHPESLLVDNVFLNDFPTNTYVLYCWPMVAPDRLLKLVQRPINVERGNLIISSAYIYFTIWAKKTESKLNQDERRLEAIKDAIKNYDEFKKSPQSYT